MTDLTKLLPNLKSFNVFAPVPIQKASFSSINSAKTISTFIDVLVNNSDLISNAGLLTVLTQNGGYNGGVLNNQGSIVTQEEINVTIKPITYRNTLNYNDNEIKTPIFEMEIPKTSVNHWHLENQKYNKALEVFCR